MRPIFIFILFLLCLPIAVSASELPPRFDANTAALAQNDDWLRLLHFDPAGRKSEVISTDFFLSPTGHIDAEAELQATLLAHAAPWHGDPNLHPRCRFPARYEWLDRMGQLPTYTPREFRCSKLERWALFDELRSVSLLLVSGYFGNPASSFGHALLRLNTSDDADSLQLLDLAFNFGALVPQNELMAVYVYRGLTGGYVSGFSDRYFYTQDLVYARTEFRDMWDYRLNLSADERNRLVLHLWELVGKKFTYYFLTKNCAYRLAQLVELVTGVSLTARSSVWYTPVELFHRLEDAHHERSVPLVKSVRFIPSSQRVMLQQFAQLKPQARAVAQQVIGEGVQTLHQHLPKVDRAAQADVVDALLSYFQYRLIAQMPEPSPEVRAQKDALLRTRLLFASSEVPAASPPTRASPAQGSAPMLWGVGAGMDDNGRALGTLRWAAYSNDLLGRHGIEDGELVVMDVSAYIQRGGLLRLDHMDIIRVRRLGDVVGQFARKKELSWHARVGVERSALDPASQRERSYAFGHFGVGYASSLVKGAAASPLRLVGWAMIDGIVRTGDWHVAGEPNVGLLARKGRWSMQLHAATRYELKSRQWQVIRRLEANYMLGQHRSVRFVFSHDALERSSIEIRQYL